MTFTFKKGEVMPSIIDTEAFVLGHTEHPTEKQKRYYRCREEKGGKYQRITAAPRDANELFCNETPPFPVQVFSCSVNKGLKNPKTYL